VSGGEGYVAAAYLVFLALVLIYVAIMAVRLGRLERDLTELNDAAARRETAHADADSPDRVRVT
jgi:hypothetical protein